VDDGAPGSVSVCFRFLPVIVHRRLGHTQNAGRVQVLNFHASKAELGAGAKRRARAHDREGVQHNHPRRATRDVRFKHLHPHVRRKVGFAWGRGSAVFVGGLYKVADAAVVASVIHVCMQGLVAHKTLALRVPTKHTGRK